MLSAAHDWVLSIPCDTPALPEDLVDRLKQRATQPGVEVVIAATIEGWHPTVALYRKSLAPDLTRAEMIFFTDEQVATMQTGAVNSAQPKAAASVTMMES